MPKKPNVTTMKAGRYASKAVVIPAPEIPPKINKGGNQHQLEAINADSSAPRLAKLSLRCDAVPRSLGWSSVAPGDC